MTSLINYLQKFDLFKHLSEENRLSLESHPTLDMGRPPHLYNYKEHVSDQLFHVPNSMYPHLIIIRYHGFWPAFKKRNAHFKRSALTSVGITEAQFRDTIQRAQKLMLRYRGITSILNLITILLIFALIWIVIAGCILVAFLIHTLLAIVIFGSYLCFLGNFIFFCRRKMSKLVKKAHICLAVFC